MSGSSEQEFRCEALGYESADACPSCRQVGYCQAADPKPLSPPTSLGGAS